MLNINNSSSFLTIIFNIIKTVNSIILLILLQNINTDNKILKKTISIFIATTIIINIITTIIIIIFNSTFKYSTLNINNKIITSNTAQTFKINIKAFYNSKNNLIKFKFNFNKLFIKLNNVI